jgi:hypothetical protein
VRGAYHLVTVDDALGREMGPLVWAAGLHDARPASPVAPHHEILVAVLDTDNLSSGNGIGIDQPLPSVRFARHGCMLEAWFEPTPRCCR